jgi:DNA-directed RNA polymerase specialized sigma24 family protein
MTRDFETEWREVRLQVLAFCRCLTGDADIAQDVFQEVAIRAWRGYPSFRRDSKFLTWVLQIAKREITRVMSKPGGKEVPVEDEPVAPPTSVHEATHFPSTHWVVKATQAALAGGELTANEGRIIFARLAQPEASWRQLSEIYSEQADCVEDFDIAAMHAVEPGTIMVSGTRPLYAPANNPTTRASPELSQGRGCTARASRQSRGHMATRRRQGTPRRLIAIETVTGPVDLVVL